MFKKALLVAAILYLCFISMANASVINSYIEELEKAGFVNYKIDGNAFYLKYQDILVLAAVDYRGRVISATIAFNKYNSDSSMILRATYVTYITLQAQIGKVSAVDPGAGLRKMKYLFDTVLHNLKLSNSTLFNYDDLKIRGSEKNNIIYVNMRY